MEYTTLRNGLKMPMLGFGVFQVAAGKECKDSVLEALKCGYRLIDTAAAYMNEADVGQAIKESGIARNEIFISTKLWVQDAGYERAKKAIETSLKKLGTDYIDLYLVHQPMSDYYGAWRAIEEAYDEGKLKAIGVSNFYPHVLADLCLHSRIAPMVNQVELHPFFQQEDALKVMKEYGVVPMAWGPFAEGKFGIFTNPVLSEIASSHKKTVAQVVLRWNIQRGVVVIPKSIHASRIAENSDVFDFTLTDAEMEQIKELDLGHSEIVNHFDPNFVKMIGSWKIHE